MDQSEFLAQIEEFLRTTGMTPTEFGRRALKDPSFMNDMRHKGRSPSLRVVQRVREFMAANAAGRAA